MQVIIASVTVPPAKGRICSKVQGLDVATCGSVENPGKHSSMTAKVSALSNNSPIVELMSSPVCVAGGSGSGAGSGAGSGSGVSSGSGAGSGAGSGSGVSSGSGAGSGAGSVSGFSSGSGAGSGSGSG
ncbi:MAG: hypothetical protein ABH876_01525 [Patescibacteria group bacterium]